jgi:hypothetical protein
MPGQPHEDGCVEIAMLVLILRDASQRGSPVEGLALTSRCAAPQHEGAQPPGQYAMLVLILRSAIPKGYGRLERA